LLSGALSHSSRQARAEPAGRRECLDHMIVFGEAQLRHWASMLPIIMRREFIARSTKMPRSSGDRACRLYHIAPRPRGASSSILQNLIFGTHRYIARYMDTA